MLGFPSLKVRTQVYALLRSAQSGCPLDILRPFKAGMLGSSPGGIFNEFGVTPHIPDYPEALMPFLGRKIWKDTINSISRIAELQVFCYTIFSCNYY